MPNCNTCTHWKNKQRLLNYWSTTGVCTNSKFKFDTVDGRLIGVIDTENLRNQQKIIGNPAHDFETVHNYAPSFSRYLLVTEESFGCNFHTAKGKTK